MLATAVAVVGELALGLVGLADSSWALTGAAVGGYALVRGLLPRPELGPGVELAVAWRTAGPAPRAAAGALAALVLGYIAWQLRHPAIGFDGLVYHLGLAGAWAQGQQPGGLVPVLEGVPVANYPVTNEVLLAWALALSRSWVAASVWTPLTLVVLVGGGWLGLRELRVPRAVAGAALAAFCTQPLVLTELGGPATDVPATAWLAAACGLCAASRRRPELLAVALVAAALSFGTKTTGALLLLVALGLAAWSARARLRALAVPLAAALVAGAVVGGLWATRNLLLHGSPLWPFVATSWGDPVPPALARLDQRFLDHPGAMLSGRLTDYGAALAGGVVLLAGGLLAPALARTRTVGLSWILVVVAVLVWSAAPFTGVSSSTELAVAATRYLLPALAAATVAIALGARDAGRAGRAVALGALCVAAALSVVRAGQVGLPLVPSATTLAAATLLGALGGLAARLPSRDLPRHVAPMAAVGATALAALALTLAAHGYLARHAAAGLFDAGLIRAAEAAPGWRDDRLEIAMGPQTNALLRGEELQHRVVLLPAGLPCPALRARVRRGWVVLERGYDAAPGVSRCLGGVAPRYRDATLALYGA